MINDSICNVRPLQNRFGNLITWFDYKRTVNNSHFIKNVEVLIILGKLHVLAKVNIDRALKIISEAHLREIAC